MSQSTPHLDDLRRCTELLEAIAANSLILTPLSSEERIRLLVAAGRVVQPDRTQIKARIKALRRMKRADKEAKDRVVRAATSIRVARLDSVYVPPPKRVLAEGEAPAPVSDFHAPALTLQRPRDCYICKQEFTQVHHFYDSMCPPCAEFNYEKRYQTAPLHGRVAVITGARLKIGQQAALMMLRAGATVVATTRFPQDSALRYMREPDFAEWRDRLHVHGLDLRHSPSVEMFARLLDQRLGRLDILINNAAQTVRRPPGFFAHLMEVESRPYEGLPAEAQQLLAQHEEF